MKTVTDEEWADWMRSRVADAEKKNDEQATAFAACIKSLNRSRNDHHHNSLKKDIEIAKLKARIRELESATQPRP